MKRESAFKPCLLVIFCLGIAAILLYFLSGCTSFNQDSEVLTVIADPNSGHPPFETTIKAVCSKEGGQYTWDETGQWQGTGSTYNSHNTIVTTWPWHCTVTWTDGSGGFAEATVGVSLENKIPVAHSLWTVPGYYQDGALILIDLRYLPHGCEEGSPLSYSGFEDPDYTQDGYSIENDGFTYHVEIEDMATGEFESVFYGPDRTLMGNEFVDIPIFYWFVNWTGDEPIVPYYVWSPMECLPDPSLSLEEDEGTVGKRLHVWVMEWGETRRWIYDVAVSGPGCNE